MPLVEPGTAAACAPGTPGHGHRQKLQLHAHQYCDEESIVVSVVARNVNRKEWSREPKAQAAMDKEWQKILTCKRPDPRDDGQGVFDILSVRNKSDVMREAQEKGETTHFGRVAELCTVKGSELDIPSPHLQGPRLFSW